MLKKLRNKIEDKRDSKDLFSRFLVFIKDIGWTIGVLFKKLSNRPNLKKVGQINFAVTYMCNSRCTTCNIWKKYKENPRKLKEELSLDEIKRIFSSRYLRHLEIIGLTGGEPFLRKDFIELCGFFLKKYPNAKIGIPTNAVNPDLTFKKLKEIVKGNNPKNLSVSISLDGFKETHDKTRGIKGNYKNALKLIDRIKKEFPLISLSMGFTITPRNYQDLLKVYNFSKEKKIGFGCWFGQISGCFYENLGKGSERFKWDEKALRNVEENVKILVKDYKSSIKGPMRSSPHAFYLLNMVSFQRNPKRKINCYSGTNSLFLDPYGDIYPCIMLDKKIGNAKQGFDKLWVSERAKKLRKFIKQKKCSCWASCEIVNSLSSDAKVFF